MHVRTLALLVLSTLVVTGCVQNGLPTDGEPVSPGEDAGTRGPSDPSDPSAPQPRDPTPAQPGSPPHEPGAAPPPGPNASPDERTFCESEAACAFWDEDYHELALYDVDTPILDVLIVPSASADTAADTPVIQHAINAWSEGIRQLGRPWFANGLAIRPYLVGTDAIPPEVLEDPEIVVLAAEYNPALLFGIGYQSPANACRGDAILSYAPHEHDGLRVLAAECENGGYACLAIHTNFLQGDAIQLHDLVTHEVGHCLGAGHVGDALDFSAKRVPVHDIMSYQHDPAQVHCVSNLNVRLLEALYDELLDATAETDVSVGEYLTMPASQYAQVACSNP